MPQLYADFAYNRLTVRLGHFYTIIGYEVVTAPDNFFSSHAYTMQYGEPFTHTGGRCIDSMIVGPGHSSPATWHRLEPSSPSRTRTYDRAVNSRLLYQLSYRGSMKAGPFHRPMTDKDRGLLKPTSDSSPTG